MDISTDKLCADMLELFKQFKAVMAEVAESRKLTPIQLGALRAIDDGYTTMGKVAQTLHCDASNVTGIVDRLTALGLVTRQEDPADRRIKTLQLTGNGRAVLDEVLALMPSRLGCDRLNAMERSDLHNLLGKLTAIERA